MRWPPSPPVRAALAVAVFLIVSLFGALVPISAAYIAGVEPGNVVREISVIIALGAALILAALVGVS
jgi:hypothetical protein